jgi:hypothetical protein
MFCIILVNLENIYGPYCNAQNTYTPDAGVVRYAGFVEKKIYERICKHCIYLELRGSVNVN